MVRQRRTHANGHFVRLLRNERLEIGGYLYFRAAGVESRFTSTNVAATLAHLKERCRLIAEKNPWTLGRLKTHGRCHALWVPEKPNCAELFQEVVVNGTDFKSGLGSCHVEDGYKILDKDVGVVKICAIRSNDRTVEDLIVTVSVSHVIGETAMVYGLWNMLNEGAEIVELIQKRVHDFRGHPISGLKGAGLRKFLWFMTRSDASFIGLRSRTLRSKEDVVVSCYEVNGEWINEQKRAHHKSTLGAPYLSTQDIITSWFFRQWDTACVGVAYDMRNHVKELTPLHMGNYQEALILYPKEYREPSNVRRAVLSKGRWHPPGNKPGKKNPRTVGWITGWHSRHVDLELPYAIRKNHLPLRAADGELPITKSQPWLCIFKTSATQYAIWCLALGELKDRRALASKIEFD